MNLARKRPVSGTSVKWDALSSRICALSSEHDADTIFFSVQDLASVMRGCCRFLHIGLALTFEDLCVCVCVRDGWMQHDRSDTHKVFFNADLLVVPPHRRDVQHLA